LIIKIDSNVNAFEAGFSNGGQTKDHAKLIKSFGVTQIIVCINKMDEIKYEYQIIVSIFYSKERYDFIVETLHPFLLDCGYSNENITYVPIRYLFYN
jgi:elongation factor 1 alpha-like protein